MQWYDAFDCEHASAQLAQRNRITLDIKQRLNQLSATLQSTSQSKQACQGVAGGWLSACGAPPSRRWRSTRPVNWTSALRCLSCRARRPRPSWPAMSLKSAGWRRTCAGIASSIRWKQRPPSPA
ncbi:hypothetical protein NWF32_29365 [Pseudomonas qingdaonensis]|nr:hypothetical protein [Pseudomonas qingdaonensis]